MIQKIRAGRQKYGLRMYLRRELSRGVDRVFSHLNKERLIDALHQLGLNRGMTVCVHSSLSRLGYIKGGADSVIDAIMETVGPNGCVLMPCFSMRGSMQSFLDGKEPFSVRTTPSQVGLITEVFRNRPGVLRSLHPTSSVAAWGKNAKEFIHDHEKSLTPFGENTPYGRLACRDDAYILMIETHIHSLLHHLQERVDFPNLFLAGEREACILDEGGHVRKISTKVMRPRIPYYVAIPSASGREPDWALIQDFALMFPRGREIAVKQIGYSFGGYSKLYQRRNDLEKSDIFRSRRVGKGEIGLLHIKSFLSKIEPELNDLIGRFNKYYDPERIASLNLPYL